MIRQTVRSLALVAAGLLLAGGAWGQVLRQSTSMAQMVALEYFGAAGGREILSAGFDVDDNPADRTSAVRPYVALTPGAAIATGNVANITYRLGGATFSQTVSPANLDLRSACTAATPSAGLSVSVAGGGNKTDSQVTFRVEATAELSTSVAICFWVPNVQATLVNTSPPGTAAADQVMGVTVTATIEQGVTNSSPFPARISGPLANDADANDDDDALDGAEVGSSPNSDIVVFTARPALVTSLGMGQTAMVALADRTKIASGGTADPSASNPNAAAMGVSVGTLSIMAATNAGSIWKLDGKTAVYTTGVGGGIDSSLGGQVMVMVGGPFQDGDKVVFGSGSSVRQVKPTGMMASTSLELKAGTTPIVYVPGGGVLKPSDFAAMAKYAFNNLDNNSALPIMGSVGEIRYAGINVEGYAYGVVRGGGMESSSLRVTCEAASGKCDVFGDCTDQGGDEYFGGPVPVPAGATAVWSSDELAEVLDGGWEKGRGNCDIYSTAPLAVQHMVRSGHTLINNSVVVGRNMDADTSAVDRIKAMRAVVDNICASVGEGDRTNDGNGDLEVDTACMPVDVSPVPSG